MVYRRKKRRRRWPVFLLVLLAALGGYAVGKGLIRPEEIVKKFSIETIKEALPIEEIRNLFSNKEKAHTYPSRIGRELRLSEIPEYSGDPAVKLNGNQPSFSVEDFDSGVYESYSRLDILGRCGSAYANVGLETLPSGDRESIEKVYPSGWKNRKYENVIEDGGWLFNRCHLIGYQLTAENDNERNLITGTRYMNVEGMLPYENMIANYVERTGNHVMYKVTPVFGAGELVCRGVELEALSVEDGGEAICFHVFCYNVQPGISIDYSTGDSEPDESAAVSR